MKDRLQGKWADIFINFSLYPKIIHSQHTSYIDHHLLHFCSMLQKCNSVSSEQSLEEWYVQVLGYKNSSWFKEKKNSIKSENTVALITLLKPLTETVAPHGAYCHLTPKLGMNWGNPGYKAISWQEDRQTNENRETWAFQAAEELLLSPTETGRFIGELARQSSCPEGSRALDGMSWSH